MENCKISKTGQTPFTKLDLLRELNINNNHYTIWIPNIKHGLKTQRKASHIRKDKTYLPYLHSEMTHIFTLFCLGALVIFFRKTFKLFGFPIF
jgi:hypothetical protein